MSRELTLCKSGCYINHQCMNHVMYADDICLMAPSAICLQKMLDVCFDFSLRNDIMFNPVKSVCVTFFFFFFFLFKCLLQTRGPYIIT